MVGRFVGCCDGDNVGRPDGNMVGETVGACVGEIVGASVGCTVGFSARKETLVSIDMKIVNKNFTKNGRITYLMSALLDCAWDV